MQWYITHWNYGINLTFETVQNELNLLTFVIITITNLLI